MSYNSSTILSQLRLDDKKIESDLPLENVLLYQPYEAEQILLAENASCLAVKTFLKMCKISYSVNSCMNAEFMSPGGRMTKLPFLKIGAFVVAEFEPIVSFIEQKNITLSDWLDEDQASDLRAYISLVENIFTNAELYITFVDEIVYSNVTTVRNGCAFPWPLNVIQNAKKRRNIKKLLNVYQWKDMTSIEVIEKVEKCCETLAKRLGENPYFFGSRPTALDAIVFGHLFTILTTKLPDNILAKTVKKFKNLAIFCDNIDKTFFQC